MDTRYLRSLLALGLVAWLPGSFMIAATFAFTISRLQSLYSETDDTYRVNCQAVHVGPRLKVLAFSASTKSDKDGIAVVIDPDSLECHEGRYSFRSPQGPYIGVFSEQVVVEQLTEGLRGMEPSKIALLAGDVHGVLTDVRWRGITGLTFAGYEDGGGMAEGRLHVLNAYGSPGESVTFDFPRLLEIWVALSLAGILTVWGVRRRLRARAKRLEIARHMALMQPVGDGAIQKMLAPCGMPTALSSS